MNFLKSGIKRVLLKLSGEALLGSQNHGIDYDYLFSLAEAIANLANDGVQVAVVVGGGNIYRGSKGADFGISRVNGDFMGMLATVINALALHSGLNKTGVESRVMSSIKMQEVCEPYVHHYAMKHLNKGRIIVLSAGAGVPFFTTDTAAVLRAVELECDVLLKGTHKADGLYTGDPFVDQNARFIEQATFSEVLEKNLKVMDSAAIALARDNKLPVVIFSVKEPENISRVIRGDCKRSIIFSEEL